MNQLTVLGTGNALTTHCYNTCFALKEGDEYFLTDAGGGNGILAALEKSGIAPEQIHHIFATHAHTDHILGLIWIIRIIATKINKGTYPDSLTIYCHKELEDTIKTIAGLTLAKKFTRHFDGRIRFCTLEDGKSLSILGQTFTFFDIRSTKEKQFGFLLHTREGKRIVFPGDEPCFFPAPVSASGLPAPKEAILPYLSGADWLLHEAFCLYEERDVFQPYEKHHSTVKDVCEMAERLCIPNLVLWHTEEKNLARRRELYTLEGKQFYTGNLIVPEDGDVISFTSGSR